MGPWHHVGVTMEITLDKKWSIIGSVGNWIPKHATWTCMCMYIYIYIMWPPAMAPTEWVAIQVRHAGTFTRVPGGVFKSSLATDPPGPRWPPALMLVYKYKWRFAAKFYVCSDVPHTHTHTRLETPRRERMKWDEMRIRDSACWVSGLAQLPFKNRSNFKLSFMQVQELASQFSSNWFP